MPKEAENMIAPSLCIVIHNVAPQTWSRCRKILDVLAAIDDFPVTLLAVPHYHGGARSARFEAWLRHRSDKGDEVALHGYDHLEPPIPLGWSERLRGRIFHRGVGEFAGLSLEEAGERLQAGVDWLRDLNLPPSGFVAPAWSLGHEAWLALQRQTFEYTCTLRRLYLLPEAQSLVCRSQFYNSATAWRRSLSVQWNESLAWMQRKRPVVRLEIHPEDLHPEVRRSWQRLAYRQTYQRRVCTLRQLAHDLRSTPGATEPGPLR